MRIRQILVNLIGNAIKFTKNGEIVVTVENLKPVYEKNQKKYIDFKLSIRDTGIGIDPEKLDAIFESFTQADSSTTRTFGGTGLGLTISKRLAELMNGNLTVESSHGEGAHLHFILVLKLLMSNLGYPQQAGEHCGKYLLLTTT